MGTPEQHVADTSKSSEAEVQDTIDYEKRYKDTQSAYTKSQQELKKAQARLEALEQLTAPRIDIDAETQAELDDLKFSDPDAWRSKVNTLEAEAKKVHFERLSEAEKAAMTQAEMERRALLLEDFNRSHPELAINDEVIKYDVPPRITQKLESGEVTFEAFLDEVASYLSTPKKIGKAETMNQPNLGEVGGGDTPSNNAIGQDIVQNYTNLAY